MASLGNLVATLGANIGPLRKDLIRANKAFDNYVKNTRKQAKSAGQSILNLRNSIAVLGAGAAAKSVIQLGVEFDRSMRTVQVVSRATGKGIMALEARAKEMGENTEFSAKQSADALVFLSMAGLNAAQSLEALPDVLDLATAGQIDLARAADISTNVMSQMGLRIDQLNEVNDTFVAVQSTANTNIEEMAQAFIYAGSTAKRFGVDTQGLSAMIGLLANNGIKASMAGTTLRQAMLGLLNPTDEAQAILNKYNIVVADSTGKLRSFEKILYDMADAQMSAQEITKLLGARASNLSSVMDMGSDAIKAYVDRIRSMDGVSKEAAETIRNDARGAIDSLSSVIQARMLDAWSDMRDEVVGTIKDLTEFTRNSGIVETSTKSFANAIKVLASSFTFAVSNAGLLVMGLKTLTGVLVAGQITKYIGIVYKAVSAMGALTTAIGATTIALRTLKAAFVGFIVAEGVVLAIEKVKELNKAYDELEKSQRVFGKTGEAVRKLGEQMSAARKRIEYWQKIVDKGGKDAVAAQRMVAQSTRALNQLQEEYNKTIKEAGKEYSKTGGMAQKAAKDTASAQAKVESGQKEINKAIDDTIPKLHAMVAAVDADAIIDKYSKIQENIASLNEETNRKIEALTLDKTDFAIAEAQREFDEIVNNYGDIEAATELYIARLAQIDKQGNDERIKQQEDAAKEYEKVWKNFVDVYAGILGDITNISANEWKAIADFAKNAFEGLGIDLGGILGEDFMTGFTDILGKAGAGVQVGKTLSKTIGGNRETQNTLGVAGGVAAGFATGGPVGAAVGAGLGLLGGAFGGGGGPSVWDQFTAGGKQALENMIPTEALQKDFELLNRWLSEDMPFAAELIVRQIQELGSEFINLSGLFGEIGIDATNFSELFGVAGNSVQEVMTNLGIGSDTLIGQWGNLMIGTESLADTISTFGVNSAEAAAGMEDLASESLSYALNAGLAGHASSDSAQAALGLASSLKTESKEIANNISALDKLISNVAALDERTRGLTNASNASSLAQNILGNASLFSADQIQQASYANERLTAIQEEQKSVTRALGNAHNMTADEIASLKSRLGELNSEADTIEQGLAGMTGGLDEASRSSSDAAEKLKSLQQNAMGPLANSADIASDAIASIKRAIDGLPSEKVVKVRVETTGEVPATGSAMGNAFSPSGIHAFANGGVVSRPSMFTFGRGNIGTMAEFEPEAIMPLKRTDSGRLGVEADNVKPSVTIHVAGSIIRESELYDSIENELARRAAMTYGNS